MRSKPSIRRLGARFGSLNRRGAVVAAGSLAAAAIAALPTVSRGQSLVVDSGNSPLTSTGTATYTGVSIGDTGVGTLLETGGALTSTGTFVVGNTSTGVGTYNLSGTASFVDTASLAAIGNFGQGTVNQFNSSSVTLSSMYLGNNSTGVGVYNMTDTSTLTSGTIYLGYPGTGTFNIGSSASVTENGSLYAGYTGTGTFNQTGGTFNSSGSIYVARMAGSKGFVTITGGTLNLSQGVIGYVGSAVYNQTGGVVNVGPTNSFFAGYSTGSSTTINLSGGTLNTVASLIGYGSTASLTLTGGTFNSSNVAYTGYTTGGNGTINLSSGNYNALELFNGFSSIGTILQSGGVFNASTANYTTYFGYNTGATGTVNLSGGVFNAVAAYVGYNGSGGVNQTGGTFNQPSYGMTFGGLANGVGVYNLSGGTLATYLISLGSGSGTLNLNGGTLSLNGATSTVTGVTTNVLAGGAIITIPAPTASATISTPLVASTASPGGGLTKLGAGVLILTGANTYTGMTNVTSGTLATGTTGTLGMGSVTVGTATASATLVLGNVTSIADGATLSFYDNSFIMLNASSGSETINRLVDLSTGKIEAAGTYAYSDLNTFFGDSVFSSSGETLTIAAPEPTSLLLAALAVGPLTLNRRRRRAATLTA